MSLLRELNKLGVLRTLDDALANTLLPSPEMTLA